MSVRTDIPCSTSALPTQGQPVMPADTLCCLSTKCRGQRCFSTPYSAEDEPHKDPGRNSSSTRLWTCRIPPHMLPCATASDLPWHPPGFQQHTLASVPSSPLSLLFPLGALQSQAVPSPCAEVFLRHILLASGGRHSFLSPSQPLG